jgi:hypothetical protein
VEARLFSIVVDRTHTVLLVEFTDRLQLQDMADLDRLVVPIAATQAIDKMVVDLRRITEVEVPLESVVERAHATPILPGRKVVLVAVSGVTLGISRQFAAHRESRGHGTIPIVPDLEAAWRELGIEVPNFV